MIPSDNSNLKRILSDIFPNKKIMIQDNNDGSQTIFFEHLDLSFGANNFL